MTTLTAVERFGIDDLFAAYHWALDTGDVEGFVDTFAGDGRVLLQTPRGLQRYDGRDGLVGLVEALRAWDPFPGCQHHAGQVLAERIDGERLRLRSFVLVAECRGEPPYALRFAGRSDDRVRLVDGRWRFERRFVRLWHDDAIVNRFMDQDLEETKA